MPITLKRTSIRKPPFNISKYKKGICELIMKTYHVDKRTAFEAIELSGLNEALKIDPVITAHVPDEEWANEIWYGYSKKKKSNFVKQL